MPVKAKHSQESLARKYLALSKAAGRWLSFLDFAAQSGIPNSTVKMYFARMDAMMAVVREIDAETVLPTSAEVMKAPKGSRMRDEAEIIYDYPTAAKKLNEIIKYEREAFKKEIQTRRDNDKIKKIGVMGCLHIPFHAQKNLVKSIEWLKSQGVTRLIIAGDLIDCLSMGHAGYKRNIRHEQYVSLKQEIAEGRAVLNYISSQFKSITLLEGNHPARIRKRMTELVGPELMFLVNFDVLSLMSDGLHNITIHKLQDRYGNDLSWIYQEGDLRICHAELGSSIELRPVVSLDNRMKNWDEYFIKHSPLITPYRVLMLVHTHMGGVLPLNSASKVLCEGLCLTLEPQYAMEATIKYARPQTNGVTYLEQCDGRTDINSIRQKIFETME